MNPVLFKIGNVTFYTHGFFMVIALLAAGWLIHYLAKRKNRNTEAVFDLVVFSLLFGIIAARITYFLAYQDQFSSWVEIFKIWQGGLVSWGGFLAGVVIYIVITRLYQEPVWVWLDMLGISGLLAIAIGRLGSFLSGEYAGKITSLPWAISGVHPVTIYESVLLFILFAIFLFLYLKDRIKQDGIYFLLVILFYCLVRFGLDFFRTDHVVWLGLTLTQIISSIIILVIIAYLVVVISTRKRSGHAGS